MTLAIAQPAAAPFADHRKRMVIATEFWHGATGRSLAEGFRQLGWDVAEVDLLAHMPRPKSKAAKAAARLMRTLHEDAYNAEILNAVDAVNATVFLDVKGANLRPETLVSIGKKGVLRAMFFPDFTLRHSNLDPSIFSHFDLIATTKSFQLEYLSTQYANARVLHVHHGFSPLVHRPRVAAMREDAYECDIGYVGNHSPDKQVWFEALAMALPQIRMRIVGHRWREHASPLLQPHVLGKPLVGDFASRAIQTSRINIGVHWGEAGPEGWQDLVSTRTFEIPAARGFMLHIDNAEVRALFDVGSEIDVFSTPDELVERVTHYLPLAQTRQEMIDRAFARAVPAYSYHARAEEIEREIIALA